MQLHDEKSDDPLRISGYGPGYIVLNQQQVTTNVLLHDDTIHALDDAPGVDELDWNSLVLLHERPPAILILGTGPEQRFPPTPLYQQLGTLRIGLEAMSTPAACRTFNILRGEGRTVAAVLYLP
jgi:uncharacterized protein